MVTRTIIGPDRDKLRISRDAIGQQFYGPVRRRELDLKVLVTPYQLLRFRVIEEISQVTWTIFASSQAQQCRNRPHRPHHRQLLRRDLLLLQLARLELVEPPLLYDTVPEHDGARHDHAHAKRGDGEGDGFGSGVGHALYARADVDAWQARELFTTRR